jgi:histidinol dehydrogenase
VRPAGAGVDPAVEAAVRRILDRVRRGGDAALRALTRRFDGVARRALEVDESERRAGERAVDAATRAALRLAARRIAAFARRQRASLRPFRLREIGVVLEQRLVPVETAGVYVPGGRYPLCSSVLMGAIPARIAGCRRVVLCTPPRRDGSIAPEILAAARLAGVDRVFAVGGAQAIAALAFGTRTIPAADLVVGPGNRYVAAAKALLAGRAGIDFVAGPTELLVIADRFADPGRVAADLLGQAEHDPAARLWLAALSPGVAPAVRQHLRSLCRLLPEANRAAARAALRGLRVIRCAGVQDAADAANRIAPEHLSVQCAAPRRLLRRLRNYGSLFLGGVSAVALGDYLTGPNHVLPTAGAARHTGGLSVLRFLKVATVQEVAPAGVARLGPAAERLAAIEGLEAHRASIALRRGEDPLEAPSPAGAAGAARAVLFDFDGVLVDSEKDHWRAFREVLRPLSVRLTWKEYAGRYLVFDDRTALAAMLGDAGRASPGAGRAGAAAIGPLVRRKRALFRRRSGGGPRLLPGAARLVRALAGRLPLAIVSGAARSEVLAALRRAGLAGAFGAVVAAEDVRRCKPDPEGYRLALRRLGLRKAAGCLAFEDSPGGVRAARAAGLEVVGVSTTYPAAALRRAGARRVVAAIGPAPWWGRPPQRPGAAPRSRSWTTAPPTMV